MLKKALHDWVFWARTDQLPPKTTDWTTWLVLGGRGAGKTRTGAEWIQAQVRQGVRRLALVGETYEDAREVMIAGPSGLCATGYPEEKPSYEPSRHRLVWPNGAQAHVFSADDPEGLRGFQFEAAWADELCKWRQPEEAWSNLQLGLRLGDRPRQVVTTTPRPMALLKKLMGHKTTALTQASTYANRENLAEAFFTEIAETYAGTTLGRQELMGELVEDRAGALWSWEMIEAARVQTPPPLSRIVVALDPPVTSGPEADECGIIVAGTTGEGAEKQAFILADGSSSGLSPAAWAARGVALLHQYKADRLVAEVNQGGDLVEQMIRLADPEAPFRAVRATRGKIVRAEPIAALYERGRIKHVGAFPTLEEQMTQFTGDPGEGSPDRLDALVWALTDLMLGPHGHGPAIRTL
ncbi:MAG: terminase family protein [Pseudomonadota bacterium]